MGCASHERQEYQVPAEHDWAECFDLDPMREIESHEGFVAAPTSLCRSSSICETRRSGRGRTIVVTWFGRFAAPIYFAFAAGGNLGGLVPQAGEGGGGVLGMAALVSPLSHPEPPPRRVTQ